MRWQIANEARSAELAITSLISNKREWNNCFIKSLKLHKFEVRNTSENLRKSERNRKKLDEDAMLFNTMWSDRRWLITKNISVLAFCVLLNVGIDPNFSQKIFFSFLTLFREKFRFPAKTFLA